MPREPRLQFENAWYHVMNRAANKKFIFSDENNKYIFFEFLEDTYKKHNIEIHAYCLMDNHFHLLIRTPNANIAPAMHNLQYKYAKIYNKINNSDGPVFKSRYKSILISNEAYLTQVCRYIHLNPVEANLSQGLLYDWSSYKYYIRSIVQPNWLSTNTMHEMISNTKNINEFQKFHYEGTNKELSSFYEHAFSRYVKNTTFFDLQYLISLDKLAEIIKIRMQNIKNLNFKFIFSYIAKNIYNYNQANISNYLNYPKVNNVSVLLSRNKIFIDKIELCKLKNLKENPVRLVDQFITYCELAEYIAPSTDSGTWKI